MDVAQFGIFLFFAAWCLVMTLFVIFLLPETKGVPIEEMVVVWRKHWCASHSLLKEPGPRSFHASQCPSTLVQACLSLSRSWLLWHARNPMPHIGGRHPTPELMV